MSTISKKTALFFSYVLVVITILSAGYGTSLVWDRYKPAQLNELGSVVQARESGENDQEGGEPQMLLFPSLELDVPLIPGTIVNERWQLSKEAASFVIVNDAINSVDGADDVQGMIIYGHNYPRLLGNLDEVSMGDEVGVRSDTGVVQRYKIVSKTVVEASAIESILPTEDTNLVIYTCTGFLDSKRLVIRAAPVL